MGKVRMVHPMDGSPNEGRVFEFDAGPGNSELRKAIQAGWTQELSGGQQMAKFGADMLPATVGTLGTAAGVTGGPAGMVVGGMTGAMMGQAGREALYGLAGIQKDDRPMQVAGRFAGEGALGLLNAPLQAVGAVPRPNLAAGTMKAAVGNAIPGVENTLLAEGIEVSPKGHGQVRSLISSLRAQKARAISAAEQRGWSVSWRTLAQTLNAERKAVRASDAVGTADEQALEQAWRTLRSKFGPRRLAPHDVPFQEAPFSVPRGPLEPAKPIGATQLEEIRKFADAKVKLYQQIRNGQNVTDPSPLERAYIAIGGKARQMLNTIDDPEAGIRLGEVNDRISKLSDASKAMFQHLKRARARHIVATTVPAATGVVSGVATGALTHNPVLGSAMALGGGAGSLAGHLATDPVALSRLAMNLNRPSFVRGAMLNAPVGLLSTGANLAGFGSPQAQPGTPFGAAKPDSTR